MKQKFLWACMLIAIGTAAIYAFPPAAPADSIPPEPYFGQRAPGEKPELFAPGIISKAGYRLHGSAVFSPDGREVFWPIVPPQLMHMRLKDGRWSKPQPFSLTGRLVTAPSFSPDGQRLYYQAYDSIGYGSIDLWYLARTDSSWSAPQNPGAPPNSEQMDSQPCCCRNGTLYFTHSMEGVAWKRGIFRAEFRDGEYAPAEPLPAQINSPCIDYTPCIAPDEHYLLFASSRPLTEERLQLFITRRNADGSWTEPANIHAALQFPQTARFPQLSPDGKYLFFLSQGDVYWVSANVLNKFIE